MDLKEKVVLLCEVNLGFWEIWYKLLPSFMLSVVEGR